MSLDWTKAALKLSIALWIGGVALSMAMKSTHPFDAMNVRSIADIFAGIAIVLGIVLAVRRVRRKREPHTVQPRPTTLLDRPWKRLAIIAMCVPVGALILALAATGYYYGQLRLGGDDYMLWTCHQEMAWRDLGLKSAPSIILPGPGMNLNPDFTRVTDLAKERHNSRWSSETIAIEQRMQFRSCMAQGQNNVNLQWAIAHAGNLAIFIASLMLAFFVGRALLRALLALTNWIMMRERV